MRYSVLDLEGGDRINLPASEFPPTNSETVRYYLDASSHSLSTQIPTTSVAASYDSEVVGDGATFSITFNKETELVGYPKAKLWVETETSDDMDLFVLLQKLDKDGRVLEQFNVPNHTEVMDNLTRDGAAILKYKGSNGRLRASLRRLDEVHATDAVPAHTFDRVEKLAPGAAVTVEIDMFPIGLAFHPGEQLRFTISGFNALGGVMPGRTTVIPENHGRHIIHTGGSEASYLQLPVMR